MTATETPPARSWIRRLLDLRFLPPKLAVLLALGAGGAGSSDRVEVRIAAFNDFHGHLTSRERIAARPVGGAAALASYLREAARGGAGATILAQAGDLIGASPPESALLQDEPTIQFMNSLGNSDCSASNRSNPRCNLVGSLGNHDLDEGWGELRRMLFGGPHPNGPFLADPWTGATYPTVCANLVDATSGQPVLPPYVIKEVAGSRIAFVGAILRVAPSIIRREATRGLAFRDEAESINAYVPEITSNGVRAIVALVHQGGRQDGEAVRGPIADIVARLDGEIDVVISGHTHSRLCGHLRNRSGRSVLVTQAYAEGTAFADIRLTLDRKTGDVIKSSAEIVTVYSDRETDAAVADLVRRAEHRVAPLVSRTVGTSAARIPREIDASGESPLGSLIADAQRRAMETDFAFVNLGGIRADIRAGRVSWGDLFAVQPFGNSLVAMELTGREIADLLERARGSESRRMPLQSSGLTLYWKPDETGKVRIVRARKDGKPIERGTTYTVAVNSYLAEGGDGYDGFTRGRNRRVGPQDVDALVRHVRALPQPFTAPRPGRVRLEKHRSR